MARAPYLLYLRKAGVKHPSYYIAFWNPEKRRYFDRSTGTTSPADAEAIARKWLARDQEKRSAQLFSQRRKSYILSLRKSGLKQPTYEVAFWSANRQCYRRVSTKSTSKAGAVRFAESYLKRLAGRPPSQRIKRNPADKSGYVYFVIKDSPDGDRHLTKIGKSYNAKRPQTFSLPFKTHVLYSKEQDMHRAEITWQARFVEKIVQGEWFALTADDLAFIERSTRESA